MIGGLQPVQGMKGMGEMLTFLNFLNNKAAYQKKMTEFQGAMDAANEVISKVAKVKDIERLWAKANADVDKAEDMRKNADAYVEQVSLEAERAAGDIRAIAIKQAETKIAPLVKREKAAEAAEARTAKAVEEMSGREATVTKREATAEKKTADAAVALADYTSRIAKLEKARDLMDAAGA